MRGPLLFLATSFAASVVAAPVPLSANTPVEAVEPLMAREASEPALSPVLDSVKRNILERLDAVIETKRTIAVANPTDANDKRGKTENVQANHDKRGKTENVQANHDKRGKTENVQANHDKRGKTENVQANHDKRGKTENVQANHDKRGKTENVQANHDKREARLSHNVSPNHDKREVGVEYEA
jgi:hypothetical protein